MSDYDHLSREELIERLKISEESDSDRKKRVEDVSSEDIHKMLFNHMTEEAHVWKLVRDDSGNIINWELVDVNPAAARAWGMNREEVVGKSADEIFVTAIDSFMPIVDKIFAEREPYSWEMYFEDINQNMKMTSVSVGEYFITTGSDVTSIKKSQEKASIFESFVKNSTDFVGIADENGVPVYLNKAGRDMVGLSPDYPIETLSMPECYPESEREFVENVILKEMAEKGYWSGETYFRNFQTGESIPVSDTHFTIKSPNDEAIIGFGTITRNFRNLKDMESGLLAAKREAEAANKAKSEFLALMSHELRTPLNAILGFSEIMKGEMLGSLGNETYKQYAADIHASGAHLTDLINSILDLAKIEAGRRDLAVVSLDVGEMVAAALHLLEERANTAGLTPGTIRGR